MRVTLLALLVCVAAGCDKKKEAGGDTKPTTTTEAKPVEAKPQKDINGAPVDVCGQISKDKVEAVVGKVNGDGQPMEGQGSMLGQCSWFTEAGMAMVSTRPINEYEGTVKYSGSGGATEIAGLGEKAYATKDGLMVKPSGKHYMLHVLFRDNKGQDDQAKAEALAKLALEQLK